MFFQAVGDPGGSTTVEDVQDHYVVSRDVHDHFLNTAMKSVNYCSHLVIKTIK